MNSDAWIVKQKHSLSFDIAVNNCSSTLIVDFKSAKIATE